MVVKNQTPEQRALEFAKQRQQWKQDPVGFFKEVLGIKLPSHQKKMLLNCLKHNRISVCTGNSIGKSFIIGALAFFYFITNVSDNPDESTVIIITSVVFSQVKRSIFANIKHFAKRADEYVKRNFGEEFSFLSKDFSDSPNTVEYWFDELSYIMGISTDNCNAISGIHATNLMIIFDEAQGIPEATYSGFRGVLQSGKAKQILLGNPTLPNGPTGEFYNAMQPESEFHTMVISAFDTPNFIETGITLDDMLLPESDPSNWRNKLDKYCGTNYKLALQNDELGIWENEVLDKLPLQILLTQFLHLTFLKHVV